MGRPGIAAARRRGQEGQHQGEMAEFLNGVFTLLPKATVQAAIGSVPLAMGLPCGKIVLSVAVLAILITAPLGALGMDAAATARSAFIV